MPRSSQESGIDVIIEGGTLYDQYLMGSIVSKALTDYGFSQTKHAPELRLSDPYIQLLVGPSLLEVIREEHPEFLNTPVIISAYHKVSNRIQERAVALAPSSSISEK